MKSIKILLLILCAFFITGHEFSVFAGDYDQTLSVFKKSPAVQPFFDTSYGYAIFPTVGKGGIVVGGAYGKGRVYRQGKITGKVSLSKVSVGFQLGGQAFSEIIFFQDKRAYEEFTSGRFEFDASMSAVVITAGAQAKAGTEGATAGASAGPATGTQAEIGYTKGLAVFVHTKGGLMYEAAIGGQKFDFTPL
jgi:lipid-binding SYLF domain-containing protein